MGQNPFLLPDDEFEAHQKILNLDYATTEKRVCAILAKDKGRKIKHDVGYFTDDPDAEPFMEVLFQPTGEVIKRPYEYVEIPCTEMSGYVRQILLQEPLVRPGEALIQTNDATIPTIIWVGEEENTDEDG